MTDLLYAITPNPADRIIAAILVATIALSVLGMWLSRERSDPQRCKCVFCRDIKARR